MKTPAGKECPYFYGDYFRGREREECRLIADTAPDQTWSPALCTSCPVPMIARANACEHQSLKATIQRPFFIMKRQVKVTADCSKCACKVADPHTGCGQCHSNIQFILGE